jgi:molecular chaperone GrpE
MVDEDQKVEVGYVPDDGDDGVGSVSDDSGQIEKESFGHVKKGAIKKTLAEYEKLKTELASLMGERDDLKDKYLRTLADFDNYRKRMKREKEEYQQYHLAEFLNDLLPVLDNLERALKVQKDESPSQSVLSGVEMIFKLLLDILKRFGVEEIQAQHMPFDPTLHQALAKSEDGTVTEPLVSEVYQKGFFYNNKLLRPALVRVVLPSASGSDTVVERE